MLNQRQILHMATPALRDSILQHLTYSFGKDPDHAYIEDWRMALSFAVRDRQQRGGVVVRDMWCARSRRAVGGDPF